ncbi:helix-turn-helix domain-containing protein [Evansella sp. AB-rgal1]|uniref:helix-turn-helix domain-containing protein n=1 Tax=Evansella sp. AB-rgal1 TaxID=3242696 RepID=UPI00359E3C7B
MDYYHWLILTFIDKINGQRTVGGIFHLIKGKRSAQTIQDAYYFHVSPFVSSIKDLNKLTFENTIKQMVENDWIYYSSEDVVMITPKGESTLLTLNSMYYLPKNYHGAKFEWNGSAYQFWDRLALTVQSLSQMRNGTPSFVPISYQLHTQHWVKQLFHMYTYSVTRMSDLLYHDLFTVLSKLPNREADLFVDRLTSTKKTGKTFQQLSKGYANDALFTKMHFQSVIHFMMKEIKSNEVSYSFLKHFMTDIEKQHVTVSAKETHVLLKKGMSIEEIALIRNLRKSTIEDHIIEIALYDEDFPYDPFITKKEIEAVLDIASKLNTKKLKVIKDHLGTTYNYFQIRLALTKEKGEYCD